jgi:hypothetical protein
MKHAKHLQPGTHPQNGRLPSPGIANRKERELEGRACPVRTPRSTKETKSLEEFVGRGITWSSRASYLVLHASPAVWPVIYTMGFLREGK